MVTVVAIVVVVTVAAGSTAVVVADNTVVPDGIAALRHDAVGPAIEFGGCLARGGPFSLRSQRRCGVPALACA